MNIQIKDNVAWALLHIIRPSSYNLSLELTIRSTSYDLYPELTTSFDLYFAGQLSNHFQSKPPRANYPSRQFESKLIVPLVLILTFGYILNFVF